MPAIFKRRFAQNLRKPVPVSPPENHGGPLWDRPAPRKPLTVKNVTRDAEETYYDLRDEPEEAAYRIKERVSDYLKRRGPDIRQPVPLTPNPWRRRREDK